MKFISEASENGVVERGFTMGEITGALWSPEANSVGAPLILSGHTGGLHKKAPGLVANAQYLVSNCGYTVAAIDAPGHGDRPRDAVDEAARAAFQRAHAMQEPMGPLITEYNSALAERAVPEWQATIDALQELPEIGADAPIGFAGVTLGSAIGLMLTAVEPRITAASFGPVFAYDALLEAAGKITIPAEFIIAWDDDGIDRQPELALFDACASLDKSMHAFPGRHNRMRGFEPSDRARFFARHLGSAAVTPA
ncbi:alpha/beta hydrolase [Nocardia sp. SYP-A9097]|uniref:alpha/beta hydrolase n=1 Tax=Nocardia sp. SYP-A9097 TaxID=2663237 RepID=UPI00129AEEF0|nr:alpha/beta hydrolase [Nocardia sp. SYP-A9097]MRH88171.1 alpha/beta hydrolase [Nocardia sp. SYP-A9097]